MTNRRSADLTLRLAEARLYLILGPAREGGPDPLEVAAAAVRGGVDVVQARVKTGSSRERARFAAAIADACSRWHPLIIVNDDIDATLESGADGVHLGQDDPAPCEARRRLGAGKIIGLSTHDLRQARDAAVRGADYIGIGAMFPTRTKQGAELIGPDLLPELAATVHVPAFAIGGITLDNVALLTARGCRRIAVGKAIQDAEDPESVARSLKKALTRRP